MQRPSRPFLQLTALAALPACLAAAFVACLHDADRAPSSDAESTADLSGAAFGGATPLWAVNFAADGGMPVGNLHALSTYASALTLQRDSGATVQTSAATLDTTPGVNDARLGATGIVRGLVIEEARTNYVPQSRSPTSSAWVKVGGTVTLTAGQTSADGTANGTRVQIAVGGTVSLASMYPIGFYTQHTDAGTIPVAASLWVHPAADGGGVQWGEDTNWDPNVAGFNAPASWTRSIASPYLTVNHVPTGTARDIVSYVFREAFNYGYLAGVPGVGGTTESIDQVVDLAQAEVGQFSTEAIVTGALPTPRAGDHLQIANPASAIDHGTFSLYLSMYPKGDSTAYSAPAYFWQVDANNYAYFDPGTQSVTVAVNGHAASSTPATSLADGAVPLLFHAQDLVEWSITAGAGAGLVQYRVNGGPVTTLINTSFADPVPTSGPIDLLSSGTSNQFSSWLASVAVYPKGTGQLGGYCGDGTRDPSEECDNGAANADGGVPCSATCRAQDFMAARSDGGSVPRTVGQGRHPMVGGPGGFATAFLEQEPTGVRLHVEAFDPSGARLASFPSVGVAAQMHWNTDPVLAPLSATQYAAVWTDFGASSASADATSVAMTVLDTAKGTIRPVTYANARSDFAQGEADALWTGSSLVVAWVDRTNVTTAPDLKLRTFDGSLAARSPEVTLAGTAAAESDVALATFNGSWAAAWRAASGATETIHVKTPSGEFTVGPLAGGGYGERPALAQVGPTTLAVVFSAGTVDATGGESETLEWALIDATHSGASVAPNPVSLTLPNGGSAAQPVGEPALFPAGGAVWLGAWAGAMAGDPLGEELWMAPIGLDAGPGPLTLAAVPVPRVAAHRNGDQRAPTLGATILAPNGALVAAWDDYAATLPPEGCPDVVLQVAPLPFLRTRP